MRRALLGWQNTGEKMYFFDNLKLNKAFNLKVAKSNLLIFKDFYLGIIN